MGRVRGYEPDTFDNDLYSRAQQLTTADVSSTSRSEARRHRTSTATAGKDEEQVIDLTYRVS